MVDAITKEQTTLEQVQREIEILKAKIAQNPALEKHYAQRLIKLGIIADWLAPRTTQKGL